jgi:hypothetical protein
VSISDVADNNTVSTKAIGKDRGIFKTQINPYVLKIFLILLFVITLFPPYVFRISGDGGRILSRSWGFLFTPVTKYPYEIELTTLFVEYFSIIILCLIIQSFLTHPIKIGRNRK